MNDSSDPPVFQNIQSLLENLQIDYRVLRHPPAHTSAESAAVRGEPLEIGAKALLLKCDRQFQLCVLPAHRKLDSAALKRLLKIRKTRFASAAELWEQTGLVPGAVPPFGQPILPYRLWVDSSLDDHPRVAFNAGALTISVILSTEDYLRAANAHRGTFSRPAEADL